MIGSIDEPAGGATFSDLIECDAVLLDELAESPDQWLSFRARYDPASGRDFESLLANPEKIRGARGAGKSHSPASQTAESSSRATRSVRGALGVDVPPTWSQYLLSLEPEARPYAEAARRWLMDQALIPTSDRWCDSYCLIFSDGTGLAPGWREWAKFVAAAQDRQESYMMYYHSDNLDSR